MIGDVLTSSILCKAIKIKYPTSQIHYLIQEHTFPVVENNPFIDKFILFDPKEGLKLNKFIPLLNDIKKRNYNIVIDVYAKISSALITAFSGAEKRISYYKTYTSAAYTKTFNYKTMPQTPAGLAIENRMLLLQEISPDFPIELKPEIYLTEAEKSSAKKQLEKSGIKKEKPLFMIGILGSSPQKTYPLQYMAEILDFIVMKTQAQLLFNYIPTQKEEAKELFNLCNNETQKHIFFDAFGKNLREFIAITSHCNALIGNEGGAVNMAKALNIPTFSIFSPQIKKENWSIYEDLEQNKAVHLCDFNSVPFHGVSKKELNKKAPQLYELLKPNLIFAKLNDFLNNNLRLDKIK